MACSAGDLVYRKGNTDDNNIWDDTALIKAYDEAVSAVKAKLKKQDSLESENDNVVTQKGGSKKRNRKSKKKKSKQLEWSCGESCRAIFTEDEFIYKAKIISISESDGTCIVRYDGYGNEETQYLANLMPIESVKKEKSTDCALESDMDCSGGKTPTHHLASCPEHLKHHSAYQQSQSQPRTNNMPPPELPVDGSRSRLPPGGWSSMRIPPIPPPPLLDDDIMNGDNEALCSMLMSWYMSGYHTGYYQGIKDGRKSSVQQPDTTSQM